MYFFFYGLLFKNEKKKLKLFLDMIFESFKFK